MMLDFLKKEDIIITIWIYTSDPIYLEIVNLKTKSGKNLYQPIPFSFRKRDKKFWRLVNSRHSTISFMTETKKINNKTYHREYYGSDAVTRILGMKWERMFKWEKVKQ